MSRRRQGWLALVTTAVALTVPTVAYGQTDVRTRVETRAQIGIAANPFTEATGDTASGVATVDVSPQVKFVSERSVVTINGTAEFQQYFRRYGDIQNYKAAIDYTGEPFEHLKSRFSLKYDNSVIGQGDRQLGIIDPSTPQVPVTSGTDIALFGTRDRRQIFSANGDVSYELSARDAVAAGAFYVRSRYARFATLGNNEGYGGSAGYSRQIDEHLRLGAQASFARYNYGGVQGDTNIYSLQGAFAATLGSRWEADGSLGLSFVNRSAAGNTTTFSGNLRLCSTSTRSNFCLNVARAVLPTGITGTQNTTSVDANYSYKITEHGTILVSAGYNRNDDSQLLLGQSTDYIRASAGYEHVLRKNLHLVVNAQYRKIFGGLIERGADYGMLFGIVYRFGDLR